MLRSILTTPWIELGGPVTITCAKTGFNANIEFHTKPFYGGKKHRITGEVYQPGDKKPFLTISGEWNGSMHAKWADGVSFLFFSRLHVKYRISPGSSCSNCKPRVAFTTS